MRIIAGSAKGRRLAAFKGQAIRPVLDQVKEAIFNILYNVTGLAVLDLFAGTGSLGLEAISRGAESATFVDSNEYAVKIIRENIERCGFAASCEVIPMRVDRALKTLHKSAKKFQLIFVDPPYEKGLVLPTLRDIVEYELLAAGGIIISEHHPKEDISKLPPGLQLADQRKYGQTLISFVAR